MVLPQLFLVLLLFLFFAVQFYLKFGLVGRRRRCSMPRITIKVSCRFWSFASQQKTFFSFLSTKRLPAVAAGPGPGGHCRCLSCCPALLAVLALLLCACCFDPPFVLSPLLRSFFLLSSSFFLVLLLLHAFPGRSPLSLLCGRGRSAQHQPLPLLCPRLWAARPCTPGPQSFSASASLNCWLSTASSCIAMKSLVACGRGTGRGVVRMAVLCGSRGPAAVPRLLGGLGARGLPRPLGQQILIFTIMSLLKL